jgi:hypothetical protein
MRETGQKMRDLVGVSHASPPPSAFASAQPPRSVFADAQLPPSDSETEHENGPMAAGRADVAGSVISSPAKEEAAQVGRRACAKI